MSGLSWLLALTLTLMHPAALEGPATHYAGKYIGRMTKGGTIYTANDMTAAVDARLWVLSPDSMECVGDDVLASRASFANRRLLVCSCANCIVVKVTDTGYLQQAGVVLDLSRRAYLALFGKLDGKQPVRAWVIDIAVSKSAGIIGHNG